MYFRDGMIKSSFLIIVTLLLSCPMYGQGIQRQVSRKIPVTIQPFPFDTLSPMPGSLQCFNEAKPVPSTCFHVNYITKSIHFDTLVADSVTITYYRFNVDFTPRYQLLDSSILTRNQLIQRFTDKNTIQESTLFGESNELQKKGSISRGVSFGNQQNLGINSTLNLELNGKLSENINISASISDANIPMQPDGNTNKLQEFDQVFIRLSNSTFQLTAGDFWISKPEGYFMNYKKRGQGFTGTKTINTPSEKIMLQSSAGLSKGKFNRQIIQGQENNQGPYRLKGSENEPFIVILSGTERVYIDGRLLTRGQEFDYTIDYNSAEVVFTSKNLITKDIRIVVEFQYSDLTYTRALLQERISFESKGIKTWFNYFQEQDLKNQPLQLQLDEPSKLLLSEIGDNIENAVYLAVDSVGFQINQNQYLMRDSLGYDSVFVFTAHPDSAKYRISFMEVGYGQGDYVLDKITAFGKTYKWVAPQLGVSQGNFAPKRMIPTPKRRRMLTTGISCSLSKSLFLESEFGVSEAAVNLFSRKDRENDWGWSNHSTISYYHPEKNKKWSHTSALETEYISPTFILIEPFRKVEFDRDWNVRNQSLSGNQWFSFLRHEMRNKSGDKVEFQAQQFSIGKAFTGRRLFTSGKINQKGFKANWDGSALLSSGASSTTFIRHKADLAIPLGKVLIGFKDDQEHNVRDTLLGSNSLSYGFYDYQIYIQSLDTAKQLFKGFYRERYDWRPDSLGFNVAAIGKTLGGELKAVSRKNQTLALILGLRSLSVRDTSFLDLKPDQSLVGRAEYRLKTAKGALSWESYYEMGSGLEQKRTFIYLEVNAGQGVYAWVDYNQDGVKDLNEFEISLYADQANYIRVFTPSNEYQKTFQNEFNQSLFWKPELIWSKKHGLLKFFSYFSNQLRWRSTRKLSVWNTEDLLIPVKAEISNINLISSNYNLRNTLYFLRSSSRFNASYTFQRVLNKTLLANGFDGRALAFQELGFRWNMSPHFSVKSEAQKGIKTSLSDYTQGRNYILNYSFLSAELSYQPSTSYRIALGTKIGSKVNEPLLGGEQSKNKEITLGLKYNTTEKGSVQAELRYLDLNYSGNVFSPVAFEMLDALKPGANFTWNISWQRNLSKSLQLNLLYSGRRPGNSTVIHSGGMELRAFF